MRRRIFLNKGEDLHQIFTFSQDKDGSIYCSAPDFAEAKWFGLTMAPDGPTLGTTEALGDGKVSLHGSGMTAVRNHADPKSRELIVHGNHLKDGESLGARHLLTVFPREPDSLPQSPAFNRSSDYAIKANEELAPLVLIFFAVPTLARTMEFLFGLHRG